MLTEVIENNKATLGGTGSYLYPHITRMIQLFRTVEEKAGSDFLDQVIHVCYSKNDYLQREGNPCRHVWLIENGIVRIFRNRAGHEPTANFGFPGEFIVMYNSFNTDASSIANVQFLTNGSVFALSCSNLEKLKRVYPELEEMEKLDFACRKQWLEERMLQLLVSNASERYQQVLRQRPLLPQIIPLTFIADYLGITLETLSRIRGNGK